jgi:hypothetical protein
MMDMKQGGNPGKEGFIPVKLIAESHLNGSDEALL